MTERLHLAVALADAGWHPAAWRLPEARPDALDDAGYWVDLTQQAESGLLDFVTFDDALSLQSSEPLRPDDRTDEVRGRLDAVLIAARVAPRTSQIGLVPVATVTHTEPFHVSKALATLDYVSTGRAGWQVRVSAREDEARQFGRREIGSLDPEELDPADLDGPTNRRLITDLFDEAGDFVEVVRRLWDSWEDGAEIRDAATGRFIDREKLHYIDFEGRWFSVRGPSITPRPPQGQPLVTALTHRETPRRFAARHTDVVFVTPSSTAEAAGQVAEIDAEATAAGRDGVSVFADLVVLLDTDEDRARHRRDQLDAWRGRPFTSDAEIFVGTPAALADLLQERRGAGLAGFRLRPAALPTDLTAITEHLVPELQRRGLFRTAYEADTLRGLLGLSRPANRYAAPRAAAG